MIQTRRRSTGFTLFELLVVLVVISLMSAMVIPRLSGYLDTLTLKTAAKKVTAALRYARNKAATEKVPVISRFETEANRLVVSVDSNRQHHALRKNKASNPESEIPTEEEVYQLPGGIYFSREDKDINSDTSEDENITIFFFPNGSSSCVVVVFNNEKGKQFKIEIDSITGSAGIAIE